MSMVLTSGPLRAGEADARERDWAMEVLSVKEQVSRGVLPSPVDMVFILCSAGVFFSFLHFFFHDDLSRVCCCVRRWFST
eukprot:3740274-Rhodomonas_salina.1